jgi:hypothetical protein
MGGVYPKIVLHYLFWPFQGLCIFALPRAVFSSRKTFAESPTRWLSAKSLFAKKFSLPSEICWELPSANPLLGINGPFAECIEYSTNPRFPVVTVYGLQILTSLRRNIGNEVWKKEYSFVETTRAWVYLFRMLLSGMERIATSNCDRNHISRTMLVETWHVLFFHFCQVMQFLIC